MNEITPAQGKKAFEVHQALLELKRQMGVAFVEMGRLLKEIRDDRHFEALGYDNFVSYVVNSELGFKKSMAYAYIEIYEWFVERLGYDLKKLSEMSLNQMGRVIYVLKKELDEAGEDIISEPVLKERSEELVDEIRELRPVDFEKKYKDDKKQEGFEDRLAPPEYFRCECHGKWIIVVPIDDCCPDFLRKLKDSLDKRKTKD